ncbi:uncharacterized protein LOC108679334 [Hyalella azteca]|uniref:Phosphatidylcholine transfer protein n=1 Tax=Hyalella azteca TaxID=294128 RepID=A0A8B7PDS8_HYAAZ|nr:uncharacterized protein LOC108679334 [Hyalella azteca]
MRQCLVAGKPFLFVQRQKWYYDQLPWTWRRLQKIAIKPVALQSSATNCVASTGSRLISRRKFSFLAALFKHSQCWLRVLRLVGQPAGKCFSRQCASMLLGAVCLVQKFDFDSNGITDGDVERCREENQIDGISALIEATVTCPVCGKRQVLQEEVAGVDYCSCKEGNNVEWERSFDGWRPFLERKNILVWRRPHQTWPHLFAYKVYGRYDDVSLCAFVETQLSTSYRTEWDPSALDLRVVHSDQQLQQQQQQQQHNHDHHREYSAQDLLYWLVKFPRFFADRDYVFKRRYRADATRREVVIVSEAAPQQSGVSEVAGVHRVHQYWSVMVVRARNADFTKPGIEYVLSYFDNPGTSLPASITNFIASTAFPNFLKRLHTASMDMQSRAEAGQLVYTSLPGAMLEAAKLDVQDASQSAEEKEEQEQFKKPGAALDDATIKYLMEGLGEMTPSQASDGSFLRRLDEIISETLDKLDDGNPMIARIKVLKNKLDYFRMQSKVRREESLNKMKDLVTRQNRYEENRLSPMNPELVRQLFEAMREVLKADHDMRTGRGLLAASVPAATDENLPFFHHEDIRDDNISTPTCVPAAECIPDSNCQSTTQNHEQEDENVQSTSEKDEGETPNSWKTWLYSVFVEAPSGLLKSRQSDGDTVIKPLDPTPGSVDKNSKSESDERGPGDPIIEEQSSSLLYYLYGWLLWPAVVKSQSESEENPRTVDASEPDGCSLDDTPASIANSGDLNIESPSPWYWSPVRGVSWLFSVLSNSKFSFK